MENEDPRELLKRLQALEAENARLKQKKNPSEPPPLVVQESEYNGHPLLVFQRGEQKPFRIGIKKLQAVIEASEQVKSFLAKHQQPGSKEDDLQI